MPPERSRSTVRITRSHPLPDMSTFTAVWTGGRRSGFLVVGQRERPPGRVAHRHLGAQCDVRQRHVLPGTTPYRSTTRSQAGTNKGAEAVIALATSSNPNGPRIDAARSSLLSIPSPAAPRDSTPSIPHRSSTPRGTAWLSFGPWNDGIHILQLDTTTGLRLTSNTTLYNIAYSAAARKTPSSIRTFSTARSTTTTSHRSPSAVLVHPARIASSFGAPRRLRGSLSVRGGLELSNGGGTVLLSGHAKHLRPRRPEV